MSIRRFLDVDGVAWNVWETQPSSPALVSPAMENGWLTFDSGNTRRRLAPIPPRWETASEEALRLMCRVATRVSPSGPYAALPEDDG